ARGSAWRAGGSTGAWCRGVGGAWTGWWRWGRGAGPSGRERAVGSRRGLCFRSISFQGDGVLQRIAARETDETNRPASAAALRVLHVNAGNLYGGIETLLVTLARQRRLAPEVEPEFALCFEGRLSEELRAAGVAVPLLGPARVSRPWTVWRVRRRLRALLGARGPGLVVSHSCWAHAIAAPEVRRAGLPFAFWMHSIQGGRRWLEWWAARHRPDFVVANSRASQASLMNLFPGVPGEVVYLPVSPPCLPDR